MRFCALAARPMLAGNRVVDT